MFPDFPNLKNKLQKVHTDMMRRQSLTYMGPLSGVRQVMIFEGDKSVIVREDGSIEESEFEQIRAKIEIDLKEVEGMTPDIILRKYAAAIEEIAKQQCRTFYKRIDEAASKVGNVFDAGGKPFCIDHFFETFERLDIDFDEEGKPKMPMIIVGEDIFKSVAGVISKSEANPEHKKRFAEIMERKREEWRVRESNRKLVG